MRPLRLHSPWFIAVVFGALLGVAGCASPASAPTARPTPVPSAPSVRDPLEAPWTVLRVAGSFAHSIRLESELVSRVDTVERSDSATARLTVSWSRLAGTQPSRLSGLVTDYRIGVGAAAAEPLAGLLLPVPFAAEEGRGAVPAELEVPASGACGLSAMALQPLRELFVSTPARLEQGTSWSDSASYEICRDSIPLRVRSVRRYRVVGAERRGNDVLVLIDRTSTLALSGQGSQFGERLEIAAEGTGAMRLELRVDGGVVIAARGESELTMTMRGRRRSQELRQRTRIEIDSP